MTRAGLRRLAIEYKIIRPEPGTQGYSMWAEMVTATANVLKSEKSAFDFDRFYTAAGLVR